MQFRRFAPAIAMVVWLAAPGMGQSVVQPPASGDNLAQEVEDPIVTRTTLRFENKYVASLWDVNDTKNVVDAVFAFSFIAFNRQNLTRIKLFYDTSTPEGSRGLSEVQLLQLVLFGTGSRAWGIGATARLTPQANGASTLAPGPAIAARVKSGKWTYGFILHNYLSDTSSQTQLQPILAYTLNKKWSVSISDPRYTYDWSKDRATSIPLSGQLSHMVSLENQPIQLFIKTQYNLKQEPGSDKWNVTAGFTLIVK